MKWKISWMVDPGDGIVSSTIVDLPTDDICEVASDAMNGDVEGVPGEVFIMGVEAQGE